MADVSDLKDLYVDELKDLWSANDQMARALKTIAPKATDKKLKDMLTQSQKGIAGHTELLKSLIEGQDEKVSKEHCKGMEGLAAEAIKHTIEEPPEKGPTLDAAIITQYQRMTHYGIAGFGTVAAFAKAEAARRYKEAESGDEGHLRQRRIRHAAGGNYGQYRRPDRLAWCRGQRRRFPLAALHWTQTLGVERGGQVCTSSGCWLPSRNESLAIT